MKKRKVKRFNGIDGSYVDTNRRTKELLESDEELNPDLTTRLRSASPGSNIKRMDGDGGSYTSPRKASFGEAFSEARRAGSKTFEFGGKRYTTELSSEKKSARSTAPTPDESAAETARLARQAKITDSSKDSEGSGYAVPAIVGAGAAAALAKAAMGKREKKDSLTERVKAREGKSQSGSTVGKMPGSSLSDPYSMQLGSDLDVKRNVKRGMKRMGEDSGGIDFKKGGKVSSASKRADGIAQRGKTRGRFI